MDNDFVHPRYLPYLNGRGVAAAGTLSHGIPGPPVYDQPRVYDHGYLSDHSAASQHGDSDNESDNAYTHLPSRRECNYNWNSVLRSVQGHEDILPERIRGQPRRDYLRLQAYGKSRSPQRKTLEQGAARMPLAESKFEKSDLTYHIPKQQRHRKGFDFEDQSPTGRLRALDAGSLYLPFSPPNAGLSTKREYREPDAKETDRVPRALMPTLSPKQPPVEDAPQPKILRMNDTKNHGIPINGTGPIVNHLPQTQRREHILQAVAEVRRVFNQQVFSGYSGTSRNIDTQDIEAARARGDIPINSHPLWMEYWQPHGEASSPELKSCNEQIVPRSGSINDSNVIANAEPLDGDNGRGYRNGNFNGGSHFNSRAGQGNQIPYGSDGPAGGNNRAPNDRTNPGPGQSMPASPENENEQFRCVFHHTENPDSDETEDCSTTKQWVSQLKVHHGGPHGFFYCAECFLRFDTKAQCKAHNPKRCPKKCVTIGCQNFNTHSVATCKHPETKGKRNSQRSMHNALHQLAHRYGPIWNGIQPGANESASKVEPSTPANKRATNTLNIGSQPSTSSSGSFPSSTQQSGSTVPSSASSKSMCSADFWLEALQTLGCALLKQLDDPSPERLEIVEDMYSSYMECPTTILSNQVHPHEWDGIIAGHRKLCRRLWAAVKHPDDTSLSYKNELRIWACGVLRRQAVSTSFGNSLQGPDVNQYQQSPTPVMAGPANQTQPQIQPELLSSAGTGPYESFQTPAESFTDETAFQDINFGPFYQLNGAAQPTFFNQQQMNHINPGHYPPSFMPFTHGDSAAAFPPDDNTRGKTSTRDSGIDTNMS